MVANLGVAISQDKDKAFLVSVENDGFTLEEYPCTFFEVKDFDGCFSFILKNQLYFCVKQTIYQFISEGQTWKRLTTKIEVVRRGTACVSLKQGTIIAGGCESVDEKDPNPADSCTLIREQEGNLVATSLGKLPIKIAYQTMTKLSDEKFIMCGGLAGRGDETREVYMGTLMKSPPAALVSGLEPTKDEFYVNWTKLPHMRERRSGHFAMYVNNRLYVFGGGLQRNEEQHIIEVNAMQCGLEIGCFAGMIVEALPLRIEENTDQYFLGKWKRRYMKYDMSFSNLILSPNQKYGVIAGGEIYGFGARKDDSFHLTMNTKSLFMRALGEDTHSLHTNNIWKIIFSCNCLTPMYDDIDKEEDNERPLF